MNHFSKSVVAFALVAPVYACSPLEQAPLIYSAAEKGGVFISTSPSSTSVIDMSIGYSVIDTAYVPVEVAKHCEPSNGSSCPAETFGMKDVRGSATVKSSLPPDSAHIQTLADNYASAQTNQNNDQKALQAAQSTQTADQQLLAVTATADSLVATDNGAVATLTAQKAASPGDLTLAASLAAATAKLAADTATKAADHVNSDPIDAAGDAKKVSDAQTGLANAGNATASALKALQDGMSEAANSDNDKGDALSVFGSFNSTSSASSPGGASLTLGKVFSTGVAAQYVSIGVNTGAITTCLANAAAAANLITDATAKQNALTQSIAACSVQK